MARPLAPITPLTSGWSVPQPGGTVGEPPMSVGGGGGGGGGGGAGPSLALGAASGGEDARSGEPAPSRENRPSPTRTIRSGAAASGGTIFPGDTSPASRDGSSPPGGSADGLGMSLRHPPTRAR